MLCMWFMFSRILLCFLFLDFSARRLAHARMRAHFSLRIFIYIFIYIYTRARSG